jgi:hypothetical protein
MSLESWPQLQHDCIRRRHKHRQWTRVSRCDILLLQEVSHVHWAINASRVQVTTAEITSAANVQRDIRC